MADSPGDIERGDIQRGVARTQDRGRAVFGNARPAGGVPELVRDDNGKSLNIVVYRTFFFVKLVCLS